MLDGVLGQDFRPKQDPIIILKSKSHTEKDLPLCSTMHTDSIYHPTTKFLMFFENIYIPVGRGSTTQFIIGGILFSRFFRQINTRQRYVKKSQEMIT